MTRGRDSRRHVCLLLAACLLAPALAHADVPGSPTSYAELSALPPAKGPILEACPDEARDSRAVFMRSGRACNATCQADTRRALVAINRKLLHQPGGGVDWSNDIYGDSGVPVNFTTGNCNTRARYCNVRESVDLIPGDPEAYLFGSDPKEWMPSYCCWRGVVCCTTLNTSSPETACAPYSVVGLLARDWPSPVRGTLTSIMKELAVLNAYGLQDLDLSSNALDGPIPGDITSLRNLRSVMLSDNCERWGAGSTGRAWGCGASS